MRLESSQRRIVNLATARARAFGRNQLSAEIEALRAEIAVERETMQRRMEALRAELEVMRRAAELWCEWRERCRQVYAELDALREFKAAYVEHRRARRDLLALYRRRALEEAWATKFDPSTTLH